MTELKVNMDLDNMKKFSQYLVYFYDNPKDVLHRELTFNEYIYNGDNEELIQEVGSENFYNLLNKILQSLIETNTNINQMGGKESIINKLKKYNFIL